MDLNDIFTLSHELRTPIAVISSAANVLSLYRKRGNISDEKCGEVINTILHNCNSLSKIVNNILDSAEENSEGAVSLSCVNIYDFAEEICRNSYGFIRDMCAQVRCGCRSLCIECDAVAIQRLFLNLISNACKYNVNKPEIIISIKDAEDSVIIKFCDNGIGIPRAMYAQVFEPFFCFSGNIASSTSGCGLGLNIVRNIVKAHNGKISVRSREGVGTIFSVRLPKHHSESFMKMNQHFADSEYSDMNLYRIELSDFALR